MSDSDSDFAYESAGEDADLENTEACEKSFRPEVTTSGSEIKNESSREVEAAHSATNNTGCLNEDLTDVAEKTESLTLGQKISDEVQENSQYLKKDEKPRRPSNGTSVSNEVACKETDLVSPETEPKRVKLRLEKKLLEKNNPTVNKIAADTSSSEQSADVPVPQEKQSSWGWGSWGTSLISSAASSVTTFTSQVSQGIGTVLETVETTLGAPPPEELAVSLSQKENSDSVEVSNDTEVESTDAGSAEGKAPEDHGDKAPVTSLFSGVTSLTKVIENTGTKVLMGGLDTLELIGKKTYDMLTEGDPGLRKKRAALSDGMTLSQVLRDAQSKAEERKSSEADETQEDYFYTKYFDEFQGLVHLEALEMLSKQCQSKVQSMLITVSSDASKKHLLDEIRNICEDLSSDDSAEEENQDFVKLFSEHVEALNLPLNSKKLEQVQISISEKISSYEQQNKTDAKVPKEIYQQAISSLAEFTAKCVEHFHKIGELILVQPNVEMSLIDCATHLTGLTSVLSIETGSLASKFCDCLNSTANGCEDPDSVTHLITSVYLEATNSSAYIQDAFQLLIPVLQLSALQ